MSGTQAMVVLTTAPSEEVAARLAATLVQERLAACVHILPMGRSFYLWEGAFHEEAEWTLVLKTTQQGYASLEERLRAIHPYEVPEILALQVAQGYAPYLAWLFAQQEH